MSPVAPVTPAKLAELLEEAAHQKACVADAERTEAEARRIAHDARRCLVDAQGAVRLALEGLGYKVTP